MADVTPEKLAAYARRQRAVMESVINALNTTPEEPGLEAVESLMLAVDGLVGAMALIAEGSDLFPQQRDKRKFADNVRTAVLKSMKEMRADLDSGAVVRMDAAKDTTH
jgi:hypothetical protein